MKSGKPRGQTPSLIGSTLGRPRLRLVKAKSHCKRCGATLVKGTECYEIPQLGGTFTNPRPYCDLCFASILEQTRRDLDELLTATALPKQ
jgi:hypothetical protein